MRIFLDTEFIEKPGRIELISLGLVAADGREYYAQSCEFDVRRATPWVTEHVLRQLDRCPTNGRGISWHRNTYTAYDHPGCPWRSRKVIASEVLAFIGHETPEFWAYYGAYDWVVFCWLFGAMMELPKGWPMYAYDLRQWLDWRGLGEVRQPDDMPHHALSDARWVAETYRKYA